MEYLSKQGICSGCVDGGMITQLYWLNLDFFFYQGPKGVMSKQT